jgi:hypothetical protein
MQMLVMREHISFLCPTIQDKKRYKMNSLSQSHKGTLTPMFSTLDPTAPIVAVTMFHLYQVLLHRNLYRNILKLHGYFISVLG